jgi:hypothetical protein
MVHTIAELLSIVETLKEFRNILLGQKISEGHESLPEVEEAI